MLGDVLHTAADDAKLHSTAACQHRELESRPECQAAAAATRGGRRGGEAAGGWASSMDRKMQWRGLSPQMSSPYHPLNSPHACAAPHHCRHVLTPPGKHQGWRGRLAMDRSLMLARVSTANLSVHQHRRRGGAPSIRPSIHPSIHPFV